VLDGVPILNRISPFGAVLGTTDAGVVMGVDQCPHRQAGHGLDGRQVGPGAALGGGGVDADHTSCADQKASVVQPPLPSAADMRNAVADLLNLARTQGRYPSCPKCG
jgi:hypothetical protein